MVNTETNEIKTKLVSMSRQQKIDFLSNSNLDDRELDLLIKRFVNGLSIKECSLEFGVEENTISKKQYKAVKKLYQYLGGV